MEEGDSSFADVHYYFNPPTSKPPHHRLSRGSYIYLFHNAAENRSKLEIANHAGTPDQDAFSGHLNHVSRLEYSYKQPTLFRLTVDGASIQGHDQWHLPSYDERNEQKFLYKIHTLDVYLWTEKDAVTFLALLKTLIPAERLELKDVPTNLQTPTPAEHRDSMSPVVQQLEKTAITSPYPQRAESTTSMQSLPGPPTPAASIGGTTTSSPPPPRQSTPMAYNSPPQETTPMAYNPAAPGAPEPIAHREKTPPPPMDDSSNGGTGLQNSAAKYDSSYLPQQQYANAAPNTFQGSNQPTPNQAYFSGPPQQQQQQVRHPSVATAFPGPPSQGTPPQGMNLPPPPPGGPSPSQQQYQQYNPSFAPPPGQASQPNSPPPTQPTFNRHSTFGNPPPPAGQTQFATYVPQQKTPSFGPAAVASPGSQSYAGAGQQPQPPTPSAPPGYSSPGLPPPLQNLGVQQQQQQQQQQQTFGYSNYSYTAQQTHQGYSPGQPQVGYTGDVHAQVYRPTEGEAGAGVGRPQQGQQQQRQTSEQRLKLEGKVRDVEGRVGGYLRRLDKLW